MRPNGMAISAQHPALGQFGVNDRPRPSEDGGHFVRLQGWINVIERQRAGVGLVAAALATLVELDLAQVLPALFIDFQFSEELPAFFRAAGLIASLGRKAIPALKAGDFTVALLSNGHRALPGISRFSASKAFALIKPSFGSLREAARHRSSAKPSQ